MITAKETPAGVAVREDVGSGPLLDPPLRRQMGEVGRAIQERLRESTANAPTVRMRDGRGKVQ